MGDPIAAGNEAVGTRKIVFFGNCQALALQRFCQRFLAPRTGDVTTVIDIAAYDVAKACVELGNADLVVEQVFDHPLEVDAASEIGADKVVRFPNVYAIFYWPYTNQRHPRNDEIGKGYDEGPYPNELGDSFLNRLILEHVPADKALEIYLREDVSARADRLLELNAEMQRKRDDAAGMDIQSHIGRHFRDDHLFRTSAHPNMRIFSLVAEGVFRRLGYTKGMVETALVAQRVSPFPRVALPIHPGVIRHLGLRFASAETRYPYFDEGDYTFAEYVRRYMNFEWNAALRDALQLAAREPERALVQIRKAARHSPRSAAAARVRSDLLIQKRDYPAAATAAQLAATLEPDDVRNWLALSRARRLTGELDRAEETLRGAVNLAPVDAEVQTEAAHLAASRGQWQAAAEEACLAVDIEPGTARFHASLSEFLAQAGAADQALAAARRAVELDPGFPGYSLVLADRLDDAGRDEEAAAILRCLIANGMGGAHAHVRLGQVLARANDVDGAVAAFRQAVELSPEEAELRRVLASLVDRSGRSEEAAADGRGR
jgi:Flp pilus assembly protein TadD